jgi:hypothetical protein
MKLSVQIEDLSLIPGYWYLATPYTLYPKGLPAAFDAACKIAGALTVAGVPLYCPIAECHPIALACGIDPKNGRIWTDYLKPKLAGAHGIIAVTMETWQLSRGMAHELQVARSALKPVVWLDPEDVL